MIQIIQEISVEVSKPNFFQAIVAKQFDSNSRFLKATFIQNNKKINIPNTSTVAINATRNNGTERSFEGTVNEDGTVTVPLTYWMLELEGTLNCDISIFGADESKLTSTTFVVEVERASCRDGNVDEAENYGVLIVQAKDIVSKAELAAATNPFKRKLTGEDDLNDLVEPGVYYYQTGTESDPTTRPANCPFPNGSIVEVIATGATDQRVIQRGTRYGLAGCTKERVLSNTGAWLGWATHPLFFTMVEEITTNANGNAVFDWDDTTMLLSVCAIPADTSISACAATPYWSTNFNKWGVHVTNSLGEALANTKVAMTIIYAKKG